MEEFLRHSERMVWAETWNLAVDSLRANKLRAALTMLGVVIGSACIVLVVTVAGNAETASVFKVTCRRQAHPLALAGEKKEKRLHIEKRTAAFGAGMAGADGASAGHYARPFKIRAAA